MNKTTRRDVGSVRWIALASAAGCAVLWALTAPELLNEFWQPTCALSAAALASALVAGESERSDVPRLTLSFLVAAWLVLPAPAGLIATLLASAPGPGRVAGPARGRFLALAGLWASAGTVQYLAYRHGPSASLPTIDSLAWALFLVLCVQGFAFGLARLLAERVGEGSPTVEDSRRVLVETVNAPLAWLIGGLIANGETGPAAVVAALLLAAQAGARAVVRRGGEDRESRTALASRTAQLDALRAIGELLRTPLEPDALFGGIDRECRRFLAGGAFAVALSDERGTLDVAYTGSSDRSAFRLRRKIERGVALRVVRDGLPVRIDEANSADDDLIRPGMRSAIVAPLFLDDRPAGVVAVQSARPTAYDDQQVSVFVTVVRQLGIALDRARHQRSATVDSLTGFHAREPFFARLTEEFGRAKRYGGTFSLLMIDLDRFKEVNDRYGHPAGDAVLRAVSESIRRELRSADLPCRYGGEEFCILLPETDLAGAIVIAERIRAAVAATRPAVDGFVLGTTASIGIASFPVHDGPDGAALLRLADKALYRAKRDGRDRVETA